jgi:PhoH-like ATPase
MGLKKRLYIIDTNVLMHDPTAIFRFEEHDVFLPMMVLEELDAAKKGLSEVARNVRQVSRFVGEMMQRQHATRLDEGLELQEPDGLDLSAGTGRLYFQTTMPDTHSSLLRDGSFADNEILSTALSLQDAYPDKSIVLVSKDINLRIKAAILGVQAEDYYNDRALDDLSLLYRGLRQHGEDFWDDHPQIESWSENGRTHYRFGRGRENNWYPNQCVAIGNGIEALVKSVGDDSVMLRLVDDYYDGRKNVWGINARNREQNFALNLLMDPEIDFVTLMGTAGTGKTLLALATGLAQTMDEKRYSEIVVTRATVSIGEDIGYLPGTEEEKMTPWMGALTDNLEVLTQPQEGGEWGRAATNDLGQGARHELHARPHLPEPLRDHRRGSEHHAEADEGAADAGRAGHQNGLHRQCRTDRHAVPDGNDVRPDLCGGPLQGLGPRGPYHAEARRAVTPGALRLRRFVTGGFSRD